jgi:hypothetical protein
MAACTCSAWRAWWIVVGLVSWFAIGVWSLRAVWSDIYILHDESRPLAERVQAAYALSRDPRVTPPQRWEMCLRKPLPELARYVLAESLTAEIVRADPRHYSLMVARSPGWPDWLRLLLVRPLAYGAAEGLARPREALQELARHHDPGDPALGRLRPFRLPGLRHRSGRGEGTRAHGHERRSPTGPGGVIARGPALRGEERGRILDRATLWLRDHHPESARIWEAWEVRAIASLRNRPRIASGRFEGGGDPGRCPEPPDIRTR